MLVYIPPQQSRFYSEDEYDIFEQEIVSVRSKFEYIYSNLSGFESYPVPNQVIVSSRTTQQLFY